MKSTHPLPGRQSVPGVLIFITAGILLYLLGGEQSPVNAPPLTPALTAALLISGLIAGLFGSLIGVGGGVILLPILHFSLGYPSPIAAGTSLLIVAFSSASGAYGHLIRNNVDRQAFLRTAPAAMAGVILGSFLFTRLADETSLLSLILGITFILPALFMIWEGFSPVRFKSRLERVTINPRHMAELGLVTGILTGLLGLGGGYLLVPGLMYFFHLSVVSTMGSSLAIIFPVSIIGSFIKLGGGYVDISAALIASAATVIGSQIGAAVIKLIQPKTLKLVFSLYFLYVSLRFIASPFL